MICPSLTLIRGLPGSGKSTLAKEMIKSGKADCHFEADMWVDYSKPFGERGIPHAHQQCVRLTTVALKNKRRVVVSNTFSRLWEMQPYLDIAKEANCPVVITTATGSFENIHGVPDDVIKVMQERWES